MFNISLLRVWVLRRFKVIQLSIISLLYSVVGKLWFFSLQQVGTMSGGGTIEKLILMTYLMTHQFFF